MISIYQKFKETIKELSKKAEITWVKNNYVPLNGVGAKGTWNINVTGNAGSADSVTWDGIENKPTSFTPASHNHDSSYPLKTGAGASGTWNINISGNSASASSVEWDNVKNKPTSLTPASHNHAWNQIISKPTDILCTVSYSNGVLKIKNV